MTTSHNTPDPQKLDSHREDSYRKHSTSPDAQDTPDILKPGAAGDFGGGEPARKPGPAKAAAKDNGGRTPGDQPGLTQQTGKDGAADPEAAGEAANPYAGT